ncbi:MAG: nitroreductase family protein [Methanomassiliicoccales archaeon]|nr:nitroreductase family protein [Methanomassiliicoccales archaeon]
MNIEKAIRDRRSIRRFRRGKLSYKALDRVLEAARLAPSGANRQPWELVVITDRSRLEGLVPICKDQAFIADCAAFVVGVDDPTQKWAKVDLSIALDHISLMAMEEGMGTCWIGAFDGERLNEYVQLPEDKVITVCMALGFPDERPPASGRKRAEELISWDLYGIRERSS